MGYKQTVRLKLRSDMGLLDLPLEIIQEIILHVDALKIPQLRLVRALHCPSPEYINLSQSFAGQSASSLTARLLPI